VKDGNARDAVKALIVANEFLESEVCELMQVVSHAYPHHCAAAQLYSPAAL
jgi:hypothetical protein